jgi:hypothetical protein
MSHYIRCDRCATESAVMGSISLPPAWQKICGADLCETCCALVHDFIRFKPSDAADLPVEPIPAELLSPGPASDKLFETAPEEKPDADPPVPMSAATDHASASPTGPAANPAPTSDSAALHGSAVRGKHDPADPDHAPAPPPAPTGIPPAVDETSAEERVRTRAAKRRKKLLGQDAPPDKRTSFPHGANENA